MVAALVGSPRLAVSPPQAAPAISQTVTVAPPPAAVPAAAVAAPLAAPTEAPPAAATEKQGELPVVAKVKPAVQDVVEPPTAVHAAAMEPAGPLAKVVTTEATVIGHGHAAGDAPAAVVAAAPAETEAAPVVEDFDSLLARCRDATTRGRWGAARTACNAAQLARPDSPDVLTRLAEIALNRGQGRAAMRLASAALAADPAFADAYVIVGSVEQGANRNQEARAAYNRYLKLAPSGRYASDLRAILATL